jgi:hypothetical protein
MKVTIGASARVSIVVLAALAACNPSPDPPADASPDPASTVSTEPHARPSPGVAAIAGNGAHTKREAVVSPAAAARLVAHVTPPAVPAPSSSAAVPAHPLAAWMRGPATQAFLSGDLESIARSFDQMARWAPSEYPHWAPIAKDGADAARAGSVEAAKAACRGCHEQYLAQYKAAFTNRPLP